MADLTPTSTWENVYQIETTDPVQGGSGGIDNRPNQNNLNRTERIKDTLELAGIDAVNGIINDPTITVSGPVRKATDIEIENGSAVDNAFIDPAQLKNRFDKLNFNSVASMQTSTILTVGDVVQTTAYYSTQSGGSALYEIVVGGTGTNDGGSFIDLSGSGLQAKLILSSALTPEMFGAVGDGDGAGGGTDRATELQNYFTYAISNGGEYASSKDVFYRCDGPLTMLNTDSLSTLRYILDIKGTIDFTNMGTTGTALSLGGTAGNPAPLSSWDIRNINIWGPESVNPINESAPETSTIGIDLSYALNVKIGRIKAQRFYKGYNSTFAFPLQADIGLFSQNWIGMYQGDATNNQTWVESQTNECHFSVVIQAAGVNKIVQQEYLAPRCEGSKVGFVIDPGSSAAAATIRSIKIDNPYMSSTEYDVIRVGRVPNFADASDRGIDSTSRIVGFQVMDGNWGIEDGVFSATRAAVVFPAAELIARSFTGRLPIDDITNAIVGVITGGMIHFTGTDHSVSPGVQWQNHYKIYDVNGDVVSYSDEDGSLSIPYFKAGNLGLNGQSTFGTDADGVVNMATAATPPSSAPIDSTQMWVADINGVDGQACYHIRTESATAEALTGLVIKTDTGDIGTGREGMFLINTFDNNLKMYADGAFRTIATW